MMLSVVVPTYNESGNVLEFWNRASTAFTNRNLSYEIIFVDDGSKDDTLSKVRLLSAQHPQVKYIELSRNFGHQIAVSAGLDHCQGDVICIIDADLQDPPEMILDLLDKLNEGFEVVYAKRKSRSGETWFKKSSASLFYRILAKITSVEIPLDSGDFRVFKRNILEVLKQMPEKNKFLRGQIAWVGFNQTYVEYDRAERNAGETGYNLRKMLRLAMDGITSFSNVPLKMVTFFGLIVSFIALVMMIYVLYSIYIKQSFVPGWGSLMVSILFIGGIQMIAIGIIGEYLSRINQNILNRPLYIIRDKNI